jgi:hypothetical protein
MKYHYSTLVGSTDEINPKYSERNLAQCYFVYHKSYMEWPEILIFNPV